MKKVKIKSGGNWIEMVALYIKSITTEFSAYIRMVLADAGTIRRDDYVNSFVKMAKDFGIYNSIQFGMLGEGGIKNASNRISKAYTLATSNHATQTTVANQPYLKGFIAPNERYCLNNPNGGSNFMTHPTISFGTTDSWSVSTVLNWNGDSGSNSHIFGSANSAFGARIVNNLFRFRGESGSDNVFGSTSSSPIIGKSTYLNVVCPGNGTALLYLNGILKYTLTIATDFAFNQLGYARGTYSSNKIHAHIIRSQALTQSQITAEYNYFRSYIPEIESVQIGTQTWATSNFSAICSSNGTLIPDGTVTGTWVAGTAFWSHHTDIAIGAIYDKLYNKAGRNIIVANPPEGWHVATEAELTTIAALGGTALKLAGSTYWTTANGTNATGLSLLGSSKRNADGSFGTIKSECYIWCADSDKFLKLTDAGVATIEAVVSVNDGYAIRLIKN